MFFEYPKTKHLDDVIRQAQKSGYDYIYCRASVKLHGTNFGVVLTKDGDVHYQSRNRNITVTSDNAGSAMFAEQRKGDIMKMLLQIRKFVPHGSDVVLYGEFVGSGIFNVGVSQLPKSWFIFAFGWVKDGDSQIVDCARVAACGDNIYNIHDYYSETFCIDVKSPTSFVDQVKCLVDKIDKQCPVAKEFGIDGVGEGLVFVTYKSGNSSFFKLKGESHGNTGAKKPHQMKIIDHAQTQSVVQQLVPEWRLEQFFCSVCDTLNGGLPDRKHIGGFIKAVVNDVYDEENQKIIDSGIDWKVLSGGVAKYCREWFLSKLEV
jgi:hypothetical protein